MKLVNSKQEIDAIRPYQKLHEIKKKYLPKKYPAFVSFHSHDGGIGGDYYTMDILEIPKNVKCTESFILGVSARVKTYGEDIFERKK